MIFMKDKELNKLFRIWSSIYRIRSIEKAIAREYSKNEMRCPTHLSIGQEAVPSCIQEFIDEKDFAVSSHRGHAHYLAKGGSLKKMICEIFGKENGCANGKGGSMHLIDRSVGFAGTTAIVANSIPIGVGLAFSQKLEKKRNITIVYFGDGAVEEGAFYESVNFAIVKKLPVFFVCENNLYSVYSPLKVRQPKGRSIAKMVKNMNCNTISGDGNNPLQIYNKISKAINSLREGRGPVFAEFKTYRHLEHCGPNLDDNLNYRPIKEINYWLKNDPLVLLEKKLSLLNFSKKMIIKKNMVDKEISETFKFARKSKFPKINLKTDQVYAKKL